MPSGWAEPAWWALPAEELRSSRRPWTVGAEKGKTRDRPGMNLCSPAEEEGEMVSISPRGVVLSEWKGRFWG